MQEDYEIPEAFETPEYQENLVEPPTGITEKDVRMEFPMSPEHEDIRCDKQGPLVILEDIHTGTPQNKQQRPNYIVLDPAESTELYDAKQPKKKYTSTAITKNKFERTGIPTLGDKRRRGVEDAYNLDRMGINSSMFSLLASEQHQGFGRDSNVGKACNAPLIHELEKIEMQKALKMKMEQFVLLFNKDSDAGIHYLLESSLISGENDTETSEKVARVLHVTEGLNKEMIGKCLGSHKEKNLKIMKAYCELLEFKGLNFDVALRLLLSTFKLPGEAQQIERIVKVFAMCYYNDNPEAFPDEDTPFILAYSLLMLSTDAHSVMIPAKDKMTKQQFVRNNVRVIKSLSHEYLEKMYDNIVKEKFETKVDYIELMYNRLQLGNIDLQGASLKTAMEIATEMIKGAQFVKYGRRGTPHKRFVWISEQEDYIYWKDLAKATEKPRSMPFADIEDIFVGCNTTGVFKKYKIPEEQDAFCFSIVTATRSLDLKAPDVETRIKWERYFRLLIIHRKNSQLYSLQTLQNKRRAEKEKITEIWKIDILPNWEFHWDYQNRKPKNTGVVKGIQQISKKKKPAKESSILRWLCGGKGSKVQATQNRHRPADKDHEVIVDDSASDDDYKEMCKNKSLLLVSVWRKGIPDWLRKTLWPITIGNRLEVTQSLYEILLSQARQFIDESSKNSIILFESLQRMQNDIPLTFPQLLFYEDKQHQQSLINILEAFVFYRPDVGYIQGMSHLAAILLLFCSEYEAFNCFINLIHSHHFLSFFRGDFREIEWRLKFFDEYFKREIPFLFNHFKALDLSSEMFLLNWSLSLYSVAIHDVDLIARIWDCFLLDGEIFAIRFGLGILKYFEVELRIQTFDAAVKFLRKLPNDIDEEALFDIIDSIQVPWHEYQAKLESQKVAQINTQIHQALLV
jgi:cytohesin/brefeldin A-inhibited guanine nucleotide-exchange protein